MVHMILTFARWIVTPSAILRKESYLTLPRGQPGPDTPASSRVNIFAQQILEDRSLYIFPPMILVGPVLRFLLDFAQIRVTIVLFDAHPRRYSRPLLQSRSVYSLCLGKRGDSSVLLFPSSAGFVPRPLQYDLLAFRCAW